MGKLRSDFASKYPDYEIGGLYPGYLDMSYFPIQTKQLKDKGLKIAIVYLHEKGAFESWLSARNRDILKKYKTIVNSETFGSISVFHDDSNEDAAIEYTLASEPDFDRQTQLTKTIEKGTKEFISAITELLEKEF